jgi:hypothetical protein
MRAAASSRTRRVQRGSVSERQCPDERRRSATRTEDRATAAHDRDVPGVVEVPARPRSGPRRRASCRPAAHRPRGGHSACVRGRPGTSSAAAVAQPDSRRAGGARARRGTGHRRPRRRSHIGRADRGRRCRSGSWRRRRVAVDVLGDVAGAIADAPGRARRRLFAAGALLAGHRPAAPEPLRPPRDQPRRPACHRRSATPRGSPGAAPLAPGGPMACGSRSPSPTTCSVS